MSADQNKIAAENACNELMVAAAMTEKITAIDQFARIKLLALAHYVVRLAEKAPVEKE